MILLHQSHEILTEVSQRAIRMIEYCGRTCYQSQDKITSDSAAKFVGRLIESGHHSVLEHFNITVRFITDRGVTHELVRHRLASYSQESTRYCNYRNALKFIIPVWMTWQPGEYTEPTSIFRHETDRRWFISMLEAEAAYKNMLYNGATPQEARTVLPNSTKTEIIVTANLREWMHILKLRTSAAAHPQIAALMTDLNNELSICLPETFKWVQPVAFAASRGKTLTSS